MGCRHGCVRVRICRLMVAMGFALDVAVVGLILGLRVGVWVDDMVTFDSWCWVLARAR